MGKNVSIVAVSPRKVGNSDIWYGEFARGSWAKNDIRAKPTKKEAYDGGTNV